MTPRWWTKWRIVAAVTVACLIPGWLALLVLRLEGLIAWSWDWLLSPLWWAIVLLTAWYLKRNGGN